MPALPLQLVCPIRGPLNAPAKSADGLVPSEEARRIEAINFLLSKGYPSSHIKVEAVIKKFGHAGKNSFRADLVALDVPLNTINASDIDELLEHAVLLGEVKRENKSAAQAKATQVAPMLDFAHDDDAVALYWDDVEQRIFWREKQGKKRIDHEAPATTLPDYGNKVAVKALTFADIAASESLLEVFKRIEDVLHAAAIDPEARYGVILQLLLAKLFDEHANESKPTNALALQDFKALGTKPASALKAANEVLGTAAGYYSQYLPRPVEKEFPITAATLFEVMELLAPVKIIASTQDVIQTFYMHFAKHLYKWDLAQFFTPVTVTDFMATVLNPRFGEHVRDPACGSADFLTSAYHIGVQHDPNYAQSVWGADNSPNAVQVAVLNMLLNGDGKSNIQLEDSLENVGKYLDQFDIMICNPPFGKRIVESRKAVLAKFDLGHEWAPDKDGVLQKTAKTRDKQQVGLLFAELCVRQAKAGGRIGIILPNGYLGNRGVIYRSLREWLLRHCRVASICSFPRFTFKTSGADVSASVLFLERRAKPLKRASDDSNYDFHVGLVESVGWQLGDKGAKPVYVRDAATGAYTTDAGGNRVLYADFSRLLTEMRTGAAAAQFNWMAGGPASGPAAGWTTSVDRVVSDPVLTLDPKRLSEKATKLRLEIQKAPYLRLGDLVDFVPQTSGGWTASKQYRYVELEDMTAGSFRWKSLRGWELPDRARHVANKGDLFVGSVWGSVQKWILTGGDTTDLLVTNGCHRLRIKPDKTDQLLDLVAALSTESYATQMRAFARGSDGLADVGADDTAEVLVPEITDPAVRAELQPFVDQLLAGFTSVRAKVDDLLESKTLKVPVPARRPTNSVLV